MFELGCHAELGAAKRGANNRQRSHRHGSRGSNAGIAGEPVSSGRRLPCLERCRLPNTGGDRFM